MIDCLKTGWARNRVSFEIYSLVERAVDDWTLRTRIPAIEEIDASLRTYGEGGPHFHFDVAFAALPTVIDHVPAGSLLSRRLRFVAHVTRDKGSLARRIAELEDEYRCLVNRTWRCRDSLAHGGPVTLPVAATVTEFMASQARVSLRIALAGMLSGRGPQESLDLHKLLNEDWKNLLYEPGSVHDALFNGTAH
jgi:hypothetical protein